MTGRAILSRGAPVDLPRSLAASSPTPVTWLPPLPDLRAIRAAEDSTTPEHPTLAVIIARYLERKAGNSSKHTIRTYRDGLRHFAKFLALSGIRGFEEDADALPASILEQWILWVRHARHPRGGGQLKPATVATYLYAVSDLFKWATAQTRP
jgi:hypothetical protein